MKRERAQGRICKVEGCEREVRTKGFCNPHYLQMLRHGETKPLRNKEFITNKVECKYPGCHELHCAKGYCRRHYNHIYQCGHVKDRTVFDRNEMIIEDDICRIKLYNHKNIEIAETIIDADDFDLVKNIKWNLGYGDKQGRFRYVRSGKGASLIKLSRLIMDAKVGEIVDHIFHNTLDNRKSKLRLCTHTQNCQNKEFKANNSSGFKHVYWNKQKKKWTVSVTADKIQHYIGQFDNIEAAKQAAIEARNKYHGNFACNV